MGQVLSKCRSKNIDKGNRLTPVLEFEFIIPSCFAVVSTQSVKYN